MTYKKLYEKVQLLKAGQVVEIENDYFKAIKLNGDIRYIPCVYCSLDSLCKGDVPEVCIELDEHGRDKWILELAHPL